MKPLLPLLLSLLLPLSSSLAAAQTEAAEQVWRRGLPVTAHVIGAKQPESVSRAEFLVLDTFTGATSLTTTTGSPRTFMAMPFNLGNAAGNNPLISKVVLYVAYSGTSTQNFDNVRVQLQIWDHWSELDTPVFSAAPADSLIEAESGPIGFSANSYIPFEVTLPDPVPLSGLTAHGIAVNFQGDTGSGLVSTDALSSLVRYGAPVAVGSNALPDQYGYRNASGRTDFNFLPTDARTFEQDNEGLVIELYAVDVVPPSDDIFDNGFE